MDVRKNDSLDKLVTFLAKRDGIDKWVKTMQYTGKFVHWHLEKSRPSVADRAKKLEVASGLSRKAFRYGRFLTGFNALRRYKSPSPLFTVLAILANGGEMVYFFFDHFLWLARNGALDAHLARRFSYISAFGEAFGYVFFMIQDLILIKQGLTTEKRLCSDMEELQRRKPQAELQALEEQVKVKKAQISAIRVSRAMQVAAIAANLADLFIAIAEVEPNPFCNHVLTLVLSGLTSAWAGWYRNWPSD